MVILFLADGFEEVEALCPLDLLRRAGVETVTVGIGGSRIRGAHGITVEADREEKDALALAAKAEMVVLPGGMPGTKNLAASETVRAALAEADRHEAFLAAICAAPSVLGREGYLKGRRATCYPGFEGELTGATVTDAGVVRDNRIITAAGMGVALEFGLALVTALRDRKAADDLRRAVRAPDI